MEKIRTKVLLVLVIGMFIFAVNSHECLAYDTATEFDYPVGKPDGNGYEISGWNFLEWNGSVYHPGEDWNGEGGGDTDKGDSVYSIANGKVVYSANYGSGWGNIIVIKHRLPDGDHVWSQYAHLETRLKSVGDEVDVGKKIGTIGKGYNNEYTAHLHFEIRKSDFAPDAWVVGLSQSQIRDKYYCPSDFIEDNRESGLPDLDVSYLEGRFSGQSNWRKELVMYTNETKTIELEMRVDNDGEAEADKDDFEIEYYFSTDRDFDDDEDEKIGDDEVNYDLEPEGEDDDSDTEEMEISSAEISELSTPGTYYFFIYIDSDLEEEHNSNNTSKEDSDSDEYVKITVIAPVTPPTANFTASPTNGTGPLTVTFTDQSTNNPTSWSWNFGDDGTSSSQNPSHIYTNTGTYTVTLTVSNSDGSDTETKTGYIIVPRVPGAPVNFRITAP
ncbi:MAG: peptidoglycan DD-metalloendopeptidase family protein [Patescibacteria group bacterium]|nr:peptidoglycan DD-metalloendopeptidase family protein [Patescibacteria group bacterium]